MTIYTNNGKITADEFTLSYISFLAEEAYRSMERDGYHAVAEEAGEFEQAIYKALKASGFYKY